DTRRAEEARTGSVDLPRSRPEGGTGRGQEARGPRDDAGGARGDLRLGTRERLRVRRARPRTEEAPARLRQGPRHHPTGLTDPLGTRGHRAPAQGPRAAAQAARGPFAWVIRRSA